MLSLLFNIKQCDIIVFNFFNKTQEKTS